MNTPAEAAAAAQELAQRLQLLAELDAHARTNARAIDYHAAEARLLADQLQAYLVTVAGVYA